MKTKKTTISEYIARKNSRKRKERRNQRRETQESLGSLLHKIVLLLTYI